MNDLIQTIKVLTEEELKIINEYIDTLIFQENRDTFAINKLDIIS